MENYNAEEAKEQNLIGKRLKELRASRQLTQDRVCELLGDQGVSIGKQGYSSWERGLVTPSCYQLYALAEIYGIDSISGFFYGHSKGVNMEGSLNEEGMRLLDGVKKALRESRSFGIE